MRTRVFSYHFDILYPLLVVVGGERSLVLQEETSASLEPFVVSGCIRISCFRIWIIPLDREDNPAAANTSMRLGLTSLSAIEAGLGFSFGSLSCTDRADCRGAGVPRLYYSQTRVSRFRSSRAQGTLPGPHFWAHRFFLERCTSNGWPERLQA